MEGVCSPAASLSRAENWTFLSAKCLARAEEQGICSGQHCRLPRMAQLGSSAGHAGWAPPSMLCSKRSLGAVDSLLHSWEGSEGKGRVRRSLNPTGSDSSIPQWVLVPPPASRAQLAPGSTAPRDLPGAWVGAVSAQLCLQGTGALCFLWENQNGGGHLPTT